MIVVALFNYCARVVVSVDQFRRQCLGHRQAFAVVSGLYQPAIRESLLAVERNFNRDLIGRPAYSAALYFELGTDVFKCAQKQIDRIALYKFFADAIKCAVAKAFSNSLLNVLPFFIT